MGDLHPNSQAEEAYLTVPLEERAFTTWLVTGPITGQTAAGPTRKSGASMPYPLQRPPAEWEAVELAEETVVPVDRRWMVAHAGQDRVVDLAMTTEVAQQLTTFAYSQIVVGSAVELPLELSSHTPFTIWSNGRVVQHEETVQNFDHRTNFTVSLSAGVNEVLMALNATAFGPTPMGFRLVVRQDEKEIDLDQAVELRLPSTSTPITRRNKLNALMDEAYLTRDVYARKGRINLWWPKSLEAVDKLTARIQTHDNRIIAEGAPLVEAGSRVAFGEATDYADGEYVIRLLPEQNEFYVDKMRVERRIPLAIANAPHSNRLYGTLQSRRVELWETVAAGHDLWATLAKLFLGDTTAVAAGVIEQSVAQVANGATHRIETVFALVRLLLRHADQLELASVEAIEQCLQDAYASETHELNADVASVMQCSANLLIETAMPQLQQQSSPYLTRLRDTLQAYGQGNWAAVNDSEAMSHLFVALSHVVDLARDGELVDLALICLDKLCFELALNSFHGLPGGGQTASQTRHLQSGRLNPLSGVARLLWGAGTFCQPYSAAVSLAAATGYEMPEIVTAAALDQTTDAWSRWRNDPAQEPNGDTAGADAAIEQAILRTPDYLLGTLVNHRPGGQGKKETVLQAVLSPEAVLSVNHPATGSQHEAYAPNFWRGNGELPRVGQWQDTAMLLYDLTEAVAFDYTHAYFPLAAYEEVAQAGAWLCARYGNGYVALTAAQGLERLEVGPTAMREVRSTGRRNGWIVQMGRAEVDGTFQEFVTAVTQLRPDYQLADGVPRMSVVNLRGETLMLDWSAGLSVNGKPTTLGDDLHVDSPYGKAPRPATHLDLTFQTFVVRLLFDPTA